jgi:anthranilate phosphoribosyltransferase
VLANEKGPSRDVVIMNAAAALYICGVCASLWDGVAAARDAIESGAARGKLDHLVKFTRSFAKAS